jgi:Spy/CpxP family protein refolding chaperone
MRFLFPLLAACVLALPVQAQTSSTGSSTAKATTHSHLSQQQRFTNANTTHDGHLTLDQAKAGYPSIARHFDAIDKDKRGYITEANIRAFHKTQRTLHHQASSTTPKPPNS